MIQGNIFSYSALCRIEQVQLQRGMNLRLRGGYSLILVHTGIGAPHPERIEEDGRVLIYEGHDIPQRKGGRDPKTVDQAGCHADGSLTKNGLFFEAAEKYKRGESRPEPVRVFDEVVPNIWAFNGLFTLMDAWREKSNGRRVYKFKLALPSADAQNNGRPDTLIPTAVKKKVWLRDQGKCVKCGTQEDLRLECVTPHAGGGSSFVVRNVRVACRGHY